MFVVDCDYDVAAGEIPTGVPNLVLSERADVDADLFDVEILAIALEEVLPADRFAPEEVRGVATTVCDRSTAVATVLGRCRFVARTRNVRLSCEVDIHVHRDSVTGRLDESSLIDAVVDTSAGHRPTAHELRQMISAVDPDERMCRGHDLISGAQLILHSDYGLTKTRIERLPTAIRLARKVQHRSDWTVVQRLQTWEQRVGRRLTAL